MFADNTLTPKEAVRLCALGTIATAPMRYSDLAGSVRHFCSRVMGPSLDLMGLSIELLRYEGLVDAVDGKGMEDDALLAISDSGRRELRALLTAKLRPSSDLSKLLIALKFRFLHLLEKKDKLGQMDMLLDLCELGTGPPGRPARGQHRRGHRPACLAGPRHRPAEAAAGVAGRVPQGALRPHPTLNKDAARR